MSPRRLIRLLVGPWGIVPVAFTVALATDAWIEAHFNMILPPGHLSLLRGSDDYGCSNLFAGTAALYLAFGFLASWHLALCLSELKRSTSVLRDVGRALWILKVHLVAFPVGAYELSEGGGCDALYGNDFRNTFLLACVAYSLTLSLTLFLYRLRLSKGSLLLLGPAPIVLWLIVGADGMTPKTWEQTEYVTEVVVRLSGARQGLMRSWYEMCERTLGRGPDRH